MDTKKLQELQALLAEYSDYINDNEEYLGALNIDVSTLDWNINCIDMCINRDILERVIKK